MPATRFPAIALAACGLCFSTAVAALPAVYKCRESGGIAVYQSTPCSDGSTTVWTRELVPGPVAKAAPDDAPSQRVASAGRPSASTATARGSHARAVARPRPDPRASACESAKFRRSDTRDRQWRTIRFDQLRELDDEVARACRS